jgi:hypothetical protein
MMHLRDSNGRGERNELVWFDHVLQWFMASDIKGFTMTTSQTTPQRAFSLTDEELGQFNRNGSLGPFDLYEPDEMAKSASALHSVNGG